MKRILLRKIPLYFLIISVGLLWLIISKLTSIAPEAKEEIRQAQLSVADNSHLINHVRLNEFQLIRPLLMTEVQNESTDLKDLNRALAFEINTLKASENILEASVYVIKLNDGEWTSVNSELEYAPGSIIKIAALITYLKMCEADPALLNKQYLFEGRRKGVPRQTFNDGEMVAGKKYSGAELLERIIVNSDNNATLIINEALDIKIFKKLFTDIGIAEPDIHDPKFTIGVNDLSKFLRILFNATYLNKDNSYYAMTLLSKSSFKMGIINGLPANIPVAHKFGEYGNGVIAQLHETGIVYLDNEPYLITIMTKGKTVEWLPMAISNLSKITYDRISRIESVIR